MMYTGYCTQGYKSMYKFTCEPCGSDGDSLCSQQPLLQCLLGAVGGLVLSGLTVQAVPAFCVALFSSGGI